MPRSITHESRLRRTAADVARFYEEIGYLHPKLAAVLVQLPPSLEFSSALVRSFFNAVPRSYRTVVTCEPRHESWFSRAADEALRRAEVTRAAANPARCVGADVPGGAVHFAYFRWHGAPQMYFSKYSDKQLATFAMQVKTASAKDAWCMFDNTARYAAWDNALQFISLIGTKKARGEAK
ncbi:MAG: hypothetical protein NVS1B6_02510 [Steroidobacteraceae bacterium]